MQRPEKFTIDPYHHLASELGFAGLGEHAGSSHYHDSSLYGRSGALSAAMDPAIDWSMDRDRMCVSNASGGRITTTLPVFSRQDQWSLCFWAKPSDITTNQYWSSAAIANQFAMILGYQDSYWNFLHGSYPTGTAADTQFPASINVWQHIAFIYDYANLKLQTFLNGISQYTVDVTGPTSNISNMGFGSSATSTSPMKGKLADTMFWNRKLSPVEINILADPSNVMLSGLINYPQRKWWPVASAGSTFKPYWAANATSVAI